MENTYTFSARSIENPERVVTFTLQGHRVSVGLGAPLEQIETVLQQVGAGKETDDESGEESQAKLWLKPLAVSLLERGVGQFRVADVNASAQDDWLHVSAWYRAGGLSLAPVTLVDGRVDNPQAAKAFVKEVNRRRSDARGGFAPLYLLDYWLTWILAGAFIIGLFNFWRRKASAESD